MMFYAPYYIILGELGISILLTSLAKQVPCGNWTTALLAGTAGGVGILVCYAIAYGITDGLIPPGMVSDTFHPSHRPTSRNAAPR